MYQSECKDKPYVLIAMLDFLLGSLKSSLVKVTSQKVNIIIFWTAFAHKYPDVSPFEQSNLGPCMSRANVIMKSKDLLDWL